MKEIEILVPFEMGIALERELKYSLPKWVEYYWQDVRTVYYPSSSRTFETVTTYIFHYQTAEEREQLLKPFVDAAITLGEQCNPIVYQRSVYASTLFNQKRPRPTLTKG